MGAAVASQVLRRTSRVQKRKPVSRDAGVMLQELIQWLTSNSSSVNTSSPRRKIPLATAVSTGIRLAMQKKNPGQNMPDDSLLDTDGVN